MSHVQAFKMKLNKKVKYIFVGENINLYVYAYKNNCKKEKKKKIENSLWFTSKEWILFYTE